MIYNEVSSTKRKKIELVLRMIRARASQLIEKNKDEMIGNGPPSSSPTTSENRIINKDEVVQRQQQKATN